MSEVRQDITRRTFCAAFAVGIVAPVAPLGAPAAHADARRDKLVMWGDIDGSLALWGEEDGTVSLWGQGR